MLAEKRAQLFSAATEYASNPNDATGRALCLAASAYSEARMSAASGVTAAKAQAAGSEPTWPFGEKKGRPLRECTKRDLEWLVGVTEASLEDPTKAKFRDSNLERLEHLRAELRRR